MPEGKGRGSGQGSATPPAVAGWRLWYRSETRFGDIPPSVRAAFATREACATAMRERYGHQLQSRSAPIRVTLSQRYQWDSRPGFYGPVTYPPLSFLHLNLLK
jgi:hypothetical protein